MKFFLDLETTGLDPLKNYPLEWAMTVSDDLGVDTYAERSGLIDPGVPIPEIIAKTPLRVQQMHTDSGLWAELIASTTATPLQSLEDTLADALESCWPVTSGRAELGGFSPQFDRRWLEVWAPAFAARLSHRNFDISTLRRSVQDVYYSWEPPTSSYLHRALADCHAAAAYWRWYNQTVMVARP